MGVSVAPGSRVQEWRVGGAGIAMIGVSYGFARYSYGLFEPQIREAFGLSLGASGALASGAYVGYLLALSAVALLADRVGPRPLVTAAGASAATGMGLVVLAEQPWQLLIGLVIAGASSGFAWAPYSDAIDQMVAPSRRPTLLAAIPSGTAFGIGVAGGLTLSTGGNEWRAAWLIFCAAAVAVTAYNYRLLRGTTGAATQTAEPQSPQPAALAFFLRPGTVSLYATAFSYGVVGAVYWTFAVAVVTQASPTTQWTGAAFWTLIGIAGTAAIGSGWAFARLGLQRSHLMLLSGLAAAAVLIAATPGWWPAIGVSAVIYGVSFIATSGLLAIWSYRVFPDRPTVGFNATVLFLGIGAIIGPGLFGSVADQWGLRTALFLVAGIAGVTLAARPHTDIEHAEASVRAHVNR